MDTLALTESDVYWIVEIFSRNGDLAQKRMELFLSLGFTPTQLEDIRTTVATDRSQSYGFYTLGFAKWIYTNGTDATIGKLIEVLRNNKFNSVAGEISEELLKRERTASENLPRTIQASSVWFNVPEKISTFTGREDEMERLHESIKGQNVADHRDKEIAVVTALSGLGGIGKTILAVHYVWNYFSNKFYFNVIWINTESADTVKKSFRGLAGELELGEMGINGLKLTLIDVVSRIYEHSKSTSTLFVFYNVEDHEHVKHYLPIKSPKTTKQYVLITSKSRVWNQKSDLIVLNVFSQKDSVEFLRSHLKLEREGKIELASQIALELQNLPLTIRQAGTYVKNVCSDDSQTVEQVMKLYLELLRTDSKRFFNFQDDGYENTISSTWKITMKRIKRQNFLALRIMQIISYFNSDNIQIQLPT